MNRPSDVWQPPDTTANRRARVMTHAWQQRTVSDSRSKVDIPKACHPCQGESFTRLCLQRLDSMSPPLLCHHSRMRTSCHQETCFAAFSRLAKQRKREAVACHEASLRSARHSAHPCLRLCWAPLTPSSWDRANSRTPLCRARLGPDGRHVGDTAGRGCVSQVLLFVTHCPPRHKSLWLCITSASPPTRTLLLPS